LEEELGATVGCSTTLKMGLKMGLGGMEKGLDLGLVQQDMEEEEVELVTL
jgi:hypothetical protein